LFRRIVFTALIAGLLGGLAISALHEFTTTPLILAAEKFESRSGGAHSHGNHSHEAPGHDAVPAPGDSPGEAWAPEDGFERTAYTTMANILLAVGFSLLLTGCFSLNQGTIGAREGVIWGAAGFAVFNLAPALGMAPEVPGAIAAELGARQGWWLLCVLSTAAGLWILAFRHGALWVLAGLVALALPHIVGAPHPEQVGGSIPPELAAQFSATSLAMAAVFWIMLGSLSGAVWRRRIGD
jgi:cobalt transporter subunit CbtA